MNNVINKNEQVFSILEELMGDNVDGIYISEAEYNGVDDPDSTIIFTSLDFSSILGRTFYLSDGTGVSVHNGLSRVTIVVDNLPYVIKMGITGVYSSKNEDWNEDYYMYTGETDSLYISSTYPEDIDFMAEEDNIYEIACPDLQAVLVYNDYIGTWHGIKIYTQEKISTEVVDLMASHQEMYKTLEEIDAPYDECVDEDLAYDILNSYGTHSYREIIMDLIDLGIEDLHSGNYGHDENLNVRIFDYLGYCDGLLQ